MRTRIPTSLVVAALLGTAAAPARGQDTAVDSRSLAYLGCWEPIESAKSRVCIVPGTEKSTVDLVTVVKGHVDARERLAVTGARVETTSGDCTSWQSAAWSARGQRIYLRSEDACADRNTRGGTGLIAMTGDGQWLYIQGMTLEGQTGVHVQRYREAASDVLLPDEISDALRLNSLARTRARAAAAAPLSIDDVIEASRQLDGVVLEAWLVERGEPFTLDANRLVALADAGVQPRIIDLMVALSYPRVFAINAASRQGERRPAPAGSRTGTVPMSAITPMDRLCSTFYLAHTYPSYDCSGLYSAYGYGYGFGFHQGGYPVTIVYIGSGSSSRPHGRVVNGQGYREGAGSSGDNALPRFPDPLTGRATAPPPPPPPTNTGSSSTSSGSSEQRTAKPRPQQ